MDHLIKWIKSDVNSGVNSGVNWSVKSGVKNDVNSGVIFYIKGPSAKSHNEAKASRKRLSENQSCVYVLKAKIPEARGKCVRKMLLSPRWVTCGKVSTWTRRRSGWHTSWRKPETLRNRESKERGRDCRRQSQWGLAGTASMRRWMSLQWSYTSWWLYEMPAVGQTSPN